MRWLLLCSILCLSCCDADKVARLEKENKELRAKLDSIPKTASLEVQEKCAKQAKAAFREAGWDTPQHQRLNDSAEFVNHYNLALNHCLVEIKHNEFSSSPSRNTITMTLEDAYESKLYASYIWTSNLTKKYWDVAPFECYVLSAAGEKQTCHSSDEFDSLVRPFMEQ